MSNHIETPTRLHKLGELRRLLVGLGWDGK